MHLLRHLHDRILHALSRSTSQPTSRPSRGAGRIAMATARTTNKASYASKMLVKVADSDALTLKVLDAELAEGDTLVVTTNSILCPGRSSPWSATLRRLHTRFLWPDYDMCSIAGASNNMHRALDWIRSCLAAETSGTSSLALVLNEIEHEEMSAAIG